VFFHVLPLLCFSTEYPTKQLWKAIKQTYHSTTTTTTTVTISTIQYPEITVMCDLNPKHNSGIVSKQIYQPEITRNGIEIENADLNYWQFLRHPQRQLIQGKLALRNLRERLYKCRHSSTKERMFSPFPNGLFHHLQIFCWKG
jgi:hypothetical protein